MQSIILNTTTNSQTNKLSVSGVAYSGGSGNAIARVEISTNGGKTWSNANIKNEEIKKDQSNKSFGWVRWSANVSAENTTEVCCRATGEAQSRSEATSWEYDNYGRNRLHEHQEHSILTCRLALWLANAPRYARRRLGGKDSVRNFTEAEGVHL